MKKLFIFLSCLIGHYLSAQTIKTNFSDTVLKRGITKFKAYKELITPSAISKKGLLTVHILEDKYYFEIPDSLLGRDFLLVTRIAKGAAGTQLYAGDEIANMAVVFEKAPGNRILFRKKMFNVFTGDSTSSLYQAVTRSNTMPIIASLNIEAYGINQSSYVVNMSELLTGDNEAFSCGAIHKVEKRIGGLVTDKSFVNNVMVYPSNIEVSTTKTFGSALVIPTDPSTSKAQSTMELNTSLIPLPQKLMPQRFFDPRVGYFSLRQIDYDGNPTGVKKRRYIKRWRVEPKPEEMEQYMKGKLVEPAKQIVFYIDPATPKKWIPYLKQGVHDWNVAFEAAGFKNVMAAKEAPNKEEDSTWSLYDARHSAIVYKPSEIENASGPSIADPRTGEILESHINWYHNVIQLLHDWYFVQCGVVDKEAREVIYSDTLMGKLIRAVIAHEVGHTLGLQHNFAASSTVSVKNLRNKKWVEQNGFCPSIMDYARFNYVAQPEDSITQKGLLPRIGEYDKWAIDWGYRLSPSFTSPETESVWLNEWVSDKTKESAYLYQPPFFDPRVQAEDLGDNVLVSNEYGIKNLKRIVPQLIQWVDTSKEDYDYLNKKYQAVVRQFYTYLTHSINFIMGNCQALKSEDHNGPIFSPVPLHLSKQAMCFLDEQFFQTPLWLLDTAILNRTGATRIGILDDLQGNLFLKMFDKFNLSNVASFNESNFSREETYNLTEFLTDLRRFVWKEIYTHKPIDLYRRNLQINFIHYLLRPFLTTVSGRAWTTRLSLGESNLVNFTNHSLDAYLTGYVNGLKADMKAALPYYKDIPSKYHLEYLIEKIENAFKQRPAD